MDMTAAPGRSRDGFTPLSRWSVAWRYGLAGLIGVASLTIVAAEADTGRTPWWEVALDLVLGITAFFFIRYRRRWPVLIAVLLALMGIGSGIASVVSMWAYISVATRRRWRELAVVAPVMFVCAGVSWSLVPDNNGDVPWWGWVLVTTLTLLALGAIGFYLGARRDLWESMRERAETAEREQQLRVLQAQDAERSRIAREMHDVVAHRISLVALHAGALAYRDDLPAEETRRVAQVIQENSHLALTELRAVLRTLRQTGGDGHPDAPQPTVADLAALFEESREAGVTVTVDDRLGDTATLAPQVGRHLYRVVQESLTNARKHAPTSAVQVRLSGSPADGVGAEIVNDLTRLDHLVPGAHLGLLGLTERMDLIGGRLDHGPTDDGRFVVRAWMPWQ